MGVTKGNANKIAHLVCQGQKEVIEEDCGDRNCIILIIIPRSQSQNRSKSAPTFAAVLKILESEGRVSGIVDGIKGRGRTSDSRCRQSPPVQRMT